MSNQETISVLNDLLHITNDRIEGFERVEGKVWEMYSDLKGEYEQMISQTKIMKNELINLITERGGKANDLPSTAGALHRAWIDIKNTFPGNRENATLENVVFGEETAINTYQEAIDSGHLDDESLEVVSEQLRNIKDSYNKFKNIAEYRKRS